MIFCSNSVYDPICLHALSKINTNLIDWLFDFSNLIIHTNFLCDRPLPEPHDMLDPTLKVSVNYNRERERERGFHNHGHGYADVKSLNPFTRSCVIVHFMLFSIILEFFFIRFVILIFTVSYLSSHRHFTLLNHLSFRASWACIDK